MTADGTSGALRRSRRPMLAAGGASLLLVAGATAWVQGGAGADPVSTDVAATCSIAGSTAAVTVPMTVDDLVDPVAPGGAETLHIDQGLGDLPVEVTVNQVVVTTPIPAQVASTDAVRFEGGNMAGSYAVDGTNLVVTFTGPQSSSQLEFPRVIVEQTIADEPEGDAIEWKVWSSMVTDTNYGTATCTPDDPTTVLNTTAISGDGAGAPGTTLPGEGSTTTTTPADGGTTTTTTPPADGEPGTPSPGAEVCVEVTAPVPVPVPVPCPVTVPPSGGGLPIPVPPSGGGLPVPLPQPGGGLPVPLPPADGGLPLPPLPSGDGLPVPPSGGGSLDVEAGVQVGVTL